MFTITSGGDLLPFYAFDNVHCCCQGDPVALVFARDEQQAHDLAWDKVKADHSALVAKLASTCTRKRERERHLRQPPPPRESIYVVKVQADQILF